jgi:endonuclease/exonuclease/phosphatase family metal-dependent hydrolase
MAKGMQLMKIASFNMENLFDRAKALNQGSWADGKATLEAYAALNAVLRKPVYSTVDKKKIITLLDRLGLKRSDESEFVTLRQNRGRLVKRPRGKPIEIVAEGAGDWTGWLDLKREAVNEIATQNTARVVQALDADVLAVVEAEDRTALMRFNQQVLAGSAIAGTPYEHVMLVDGNDERGIDVGIFTKASHSITSIRSHVDDEDDDGSRIFSRDCAEYEIHLPSQQPLLVLINHLKSKGYGGQAASNARRALQAKRIRAIYDGLRQDGVSDIVILGDFNDTPDSEPLAPLLGDHSDLKDVSLHPKFQSDGRPGTFGNGTKSNKIDYILLSPALFERVTVAGAFREGVWGGKNGTLFPHFDTITKANEAASDHAAIWAELDI